MNGRRLIVSLHDAAPPFEGAIRGQIERLTALGVSRYVLNVVPSWHGQFPLHRHPAFCDFLRTRSEQGHQIVLHGFEHRPRGPWHGPALLLLRAQLFAPGAAEFLTRPPGSAVLAIDAGMRELHAAGLDGTDTFCAPGWLIDRQVSSALVDAGIRYLTGMFSWHDLYTGDVRWLPSLGYMGAGGRQELGVAFMNAAALRLAGRWADTLVVYLHPQGDQHGPAVRRVYALIGALLAQGWRPATYGDLVGE